MTVKEEQDHLQNEKSSAYRLMSKMWAFKDFMEFVKSIKENAIKDLYQVTDFQATEAKFGEIRGTLKAVEKIEKELDYILNWMEES